SPTSRVFFVLSAQSGSVQDPPGGSAGKQGVGVDKGKAVYVSHRETHLFGRLFHDPTCGI
ncbi:MAG: hypothetical protein Q4A40_07210, partial [Bacillota bacterium]|nr:hypothetical protein [Bacillota bacterium]